MSGRDGAYNEQIIAIILSDVRTDRPLKPKVTGSSAINNKNQKNSKKSGKTPKRNQVLRSNKNTITNYNSIEPMRDDEEEQQNISEIHSEIFAQIYSPVVTRATVLRMYHSARV